MVRVHCCTFYNNNNQLNWQSNGLLIRWLQVRVLYCVVSILYEKYIHLVELVDTKDLKSFTAMCNGSSPLVRKFYYIYLRVRGSQIGKASHFGCENCRFESYPHNFFQRSLNRLECQFVNLDGKGSSPFASIIAHLFNILLGSSVGRAKA